MNQEIVVNMKNEMSRSKATAGRNLLQNGQTNKPLEVHVDDELRMFAILPYLYTMVKEAENEDALFVSWHKRGESRPYLHLFI